MLKLHQQTLNLQGDVYKRDHMVIEAQQRLRDLGRPEQLQLIWNYVIDGEHYEFAKTLLAGEFFRALELEFADVLAKYTDPDRPDLLAIEMAQVLENFSRVSAAFVRACPDDWQKSLGKLIPDESGSSEESEKKRRKM